MNILVLSLTKKLRKPDKTEYLDKFEALKSDSRSVEVKEIFDNAVLLEHELKKAAKAKPDLIIVSGRLKNENAFRQRFAFIIRNAERKMVYWSTNELYACDTQRMGLSGSQSGGHKSRSSDFLCAGMYRE